ncbi:ubiquinone biosynthesis protein [Niveomyces insectorum RCEF 264]|uniref:5-demethoxyubiquinone hydroxylase, mitochondrial n=1 Tax=Niveomyces insectorum RCEF 264 TaxID=1081102 RepID=A0A162JBN7_9HYPO|nr:ubiquinone biosynthesis protein [Niveomyces insectorum RCEF 264]
MSKANTERRPQSSPRRQEPFPLSQFFAIPPFWYNGIEKGLQHVPGDFKDGVAFCTPAEWPPSLFAGLPALPPMWPVYDLRTPVCCRRVRPYSRGRHNCFFNAAAAAASVSDIRPARRKWRQAEAQALRVNQTGELAATLIYTAQTPLVVRQHPHLRPLMQHMYDQEAGHLATFNKLMAKHRVRPTALYPLWSVLASGLGWSTALMGREAAMACTEAVETEIGTHYNGQIRELLAMTSAWEEEGYDVGPELSELIQTLRRIRDEELEHLDHAVENDAKKAEPHWLLTGAIRLGCRGAIWVSERV